MERMKFLWIFFALDRKETRNFEFVDFCVSGGTNKSPKQQLDLIELCRSVLYAFPNIRDQLCAFKNRIWYPLRISQSESYGLSNLDIGLLILNLTVLISSSLWPPLTKYKRSYLSPSLELFGLVSTFVSDCEIPRGYEFKKWVTDDWWHIWTNYVLLNE